tara:strand:+ start:88 stop:504 length:417 start_codon:yes stop_codon:yes gene_type:complete
MAKAQLKVTNKCTSDLGTIVMHTVELLDADGVMKEYGIKDYHDNDGIYDTEIEDISTGEDVYIDSTLGKRIIDTLEEYDNDNDNTSSTGDSVEDVINEYIAAQNDKRDSMTYEDAHVNNDIIVPCSAELDNEMYNESI